MAATLLQSLLWEHWGTPTPCAPEEWDANMPAYGLQYPCVSYTDLDTLIGKKSQEEVRSAAEGGEHSDAACAPLSFNGDTTPVEIVVCSALNVVGAHGRLSLCPLLTTRATLTTLMDKGTCLHPYTRFADTAGRTGGRRRRSSTSRCHGADMVKVRQGKPVTKDVTGHREEGRGWPSEANAPLHRQRRIRPSSVDRSNGKAACTETCLRRWERGKAVKSYLLLPIPPM